MPVRWIFTSPAASDAVRLLADAIRVPIFLAKLLIERGFALPDEAEGFLTPRLKALADPFLLPDMERAVTRILAALDARERIVLYGDYDVDGVTSLALLQTMLTAYGAEVRTFLPSRMEEGYGLSAEGVERCLRECSPQLLIAVDCGTSSVAEIEFLRSQGVSTVVVDHHECKEVLPECEALVNPKRGNGGNGGGGFDYLCSVGLVFKLCHALLKHRPLGGFDLRDHLDLVALGTVADLVPLVGENRILVQAGLPRISRSTRPGVQALVEVAGVKSPTTPVDVGFRLGPRLNAAGRLGTAQDALELLLTADGARASELAAGLDLQNRERQEVERKTLEEAESRVESQVEEGVAIVVGARDWHPGVLGIVASRLMRAHHRPTIVVGFDETGLGRGSGRSIEGVSLVAALGECAALLEKFGGHEMAAGVTVREENFEQFCERFHAVVRGMVSDEMLAPRIRIDAELTLDEVTLELLAAHERLQPFGMANSQPLFCAQGVAPVSEPRVLKERHLLFSLRQRGKPMSAIFFGGAECELPPPPWDVAFRIERNEYRGVVSPQIQIQHVRASE